MYSIFVCTVVIVFFLFGRNSSILPPYVKKDSYKYICGIQHTEKICSILIESDEGRQARGVTSQMTSHRSTSNKGNKKETYEDRSVCSRWSSSSSSLRVLVHSFVPVLVAHVSQAYLVDRQIDR